MTKEKDIKSAHHVLIVDDDHDDLATLSDSFHALSEERWHIHEACNTSDALAVIKAKKIQLVILAVNTPVLDVSLLLGSLGQSGSQFKKVVMAARPTDEQRDASLAGGADFFLEKPFSPEGLKSVFTQLCRLLDWSSPQAFPGTARGVGLPDLIQMECLARNSSVLELYREQSLGRIYIEDGQIIHAVCGEMSGEHAFQKLLTLIGITFELRDFELPPERTLNRTWEYLLSEAARRREQIGRDARAGSPFFTGAETVSSEPANHAAEMLICSSDGKVLYNWQCLAPADRVALLQNVAHCADQLIPELQLGKLDRVEIQLTESRAILQPRADRLIFARVTNPVKREG